MAGARCDERLVIHHVTNGGCFDDFNKAMEECRGRYSPDTSQLNLIRDQTNPSTSRRSLHLCENQNDVKL